MFFSSPDTLLEYITDIILIEESNGELGLLLPDSLFIFGPAVAIPVKARGKDLDGYFSGLTTRVPLVILSDVDM